MITTKMKAPDNDLLELIMNSSHTLIAGTTGSGKSVLLNSILYGLALNINSIFVLIDTKRVELKNYGVIPRNFNRVTEPETVPEVLDLIIDFMDGRYERMSGKLSDEHPVYVVIDELADLVTGDGPESKHILNQIVKIGRLGRAAKIHLICCTQDPSRRTLSAQLMQNFNTCIALRCKTAIESRQIIGTEGAELLPRYGKAIVANADGYKTIDVPMTPEDDIKELCASLAELHQWVIDLENYKDELNYQMGLEESSLYSKSFRKKTKAEIAGAEPKEPRWIDPELRKALIDGSWIRKWV